MREKELVDFEKLEKNEDDEYIDKDGNEIGCQICYTHKKAYEYFDSDEKKENLVKIPRPRCPKCGNKLDRCYNYTSSTRNNAIVSETNYTNPNGNIGLYSIWECDKCENKYGHNLTFALMPEPVVHNANHDIYYTGGKDYMIDNEMEEIAGLIYEKIMPSILQYIERKMNPKDPFDERLGPWNISTWCKSDIEHAIATYLYRHGLKK